MCVDGVCGVGVWWVGERYLERVIVMASDVPPHATRNRLFERAASQLFSASHDRSRALIILYMQHIGINCNWHQHSRTSNYDSTARAAVNCDSKKNERC